jgi:L-ascorbate metabolism protein UlaG (beta-lactamase superfamily)
LRQHGCYLKREGRAHSLWCNPRTGVVEAPTTRSPRSDALLALATIVLVAASTAPARALDVRWLGVAGFTLTSGETTIAHDPYLSRPGMLSVLFNRYEPDAAVLGRMVGPESPAPELARASLFLVGHGHYDHVGDVAWLAAHSGGRVAGSATAANIARGYGLAAERTLVVEPGAVMEEGGTFEVRVVESRHAKVFFGRVPLEGEVLEPPPGPIHVFSMKLGDARAYFVTERATGASVVLLSSAALHLPALEELGQTAAPVDLLLAATGGRDASYASDLVRTLRPRLVVPHHFDDFRIPITDPTAGDPRDPDDLAAFERELADAARAQGVPVEVRRLRLFESIQVVR